VLSSSPPVTLQRNTRAGTDRDCLPAIGLFFSGAPALPGVLITDTGSYSGLVFGLAQLLGVDYRPALADLADQKGWRTGPGAGDGPLNTFARGNGTWPRGPALR
jgi:Tn3 transposase DDE domain